MEGRAISTAALILGVLLILPTAYLTLVSLYLLVLTAAAWCYRPRTNPDAPPLRFALLIPAHDEEGQLPSILKDAAALDYPEESRTVYVIADNCTDKTAEIAQEHGAVALERSDPLNPGKGQALDWALDTYHRMFEGCDAIALVDADMVIHPAFLRELSASLSVEGVEVVQALNTVARPEQNWRTALGFLGFSVINHLRPSGRCMLRGTAGLKGTGMAFRAELLLRYGWPAQSIAEDVEFTQQLLMDGIRVHYNPRAQVTSEIATRPDQVRVQQQRWEGGRYHVTRKYFPILLGGLVRKPSLALLDAVLDLIVPPQSLLILMLLAATGLSALVDPLWFLLLAGCLAAVAVCVFSALILAKAPARVWLYLLFVPLFVLGKIPVFARVLLSKTGATWQRTPRNNE